VAELDIISHQSSSANDADDIELVVRIYGPDHDVHIEHHISVRNLQIPKNFTVPQHIIECASSTLGHGIPEQCRPLLASLTPVLTAGEALNTALFYTLVFVLVLFLLVVAPARIMRNHLVDRRGKSGRLLAYIAFLTALVLALRTN
jgi:hypothetical protein